MFVIIDYLILSFLADGIIGAEYTSGSRPAFANQHPNVYIFESDENGNQLNLTLPCPIDSPSPTVNYTWFRGSQELPESMVNVDGSLIVPNITEGENASREGVDYYCIASDNIQFGFDIAIRSRTITVFYAYFDGFEQKAESNNSTTEVPIPVALNSDVALKCDVLDAKPPPQIKWYNDTGEIQEVQQNNSVRFLNGGHYLYIRKLQSMHLQHQYYCSVTNANLSQEILAPTRYVLVDNLTQGVLMDYKQIGNHTAFVGNTSFEFAYIGGVFGNNMMNGTLNTPLRVNHEDVPVVGNIGQINNILSPVLSSSSQRMIQLEANVHYNSFSSFETKLGILTVHQLPRITNTIPDERDHLVGDGSLTYICQFEGSPLPNVTFYHNGAFISPGSGVNITGNILTILSPQVSHSGIYQCIISNEFGDDQQAWLLEIRQPVYISPEVQPYNSTEFNIFDDRDLGALIVRPNSSTLSFSMDVVADPCPSIVWNFNGTALRTNDAIAFNNPCTEQSMRLSLSWTFMLNVTVSNATSGSYSAILSNIAGTTQLPKPVYITIPEPVSITSLILNETCLKEGSTVALRCNVLGFPRPMIQFRVNDTLITPKEGDFENFVLEFYDQITIINITMRAVGRYSCFDPLSQTNASDVLPAIQSVNFCETPKDESMLLPPGAIAGIVIILLAVAGVIVIVAMLAIATVRLRKPTTNHLSQQVISLENTTVSYSEAPTRPLAPRDRTQSLQPTSNRTEETEHLKMKRYKSERKGRKPSAQLDTIKESPTGGHV